ncbi:MAG: MFS transporter [Stellaceae bacterium]
MSEKEPKGAWPRLIVSLALATIGGSGFWSVVVALPAIGATFAVNRADASLAYGATMVGYAAGTLVMARLADRFGITLPVAVGTVLIGIGFIAVGYAPSLGSFMLAQAVLVGVGSAAVYTPLVADVSHWFTRRRGMAISICASGIPLAGAVWPPVMEYFFGMVGWQHTFVLLGIFCLATMAPLILALRRPTPIPDYGPAAAARTGRTGAAALGLTPRRLQITLVVAGVMCCVAMSVPQVHLVAYCRGLGYGATNGADMLSLMLAASLLSRVAFGWGSDRIGGLATLLLGSVMQAAALMLYGFFDGLDTLYAISALFGFVQSGIVPSYAMIVREYFPPRQAASRLAPISVANFIGMSVGAWMAGEIFDLTGSYHMAFLNGALWNAVNIAIVAWLLLQARRWKTANVAPAAA